MLTLLPLLLSMGFNILNSSKDILLYGCLTLLIIGINSVGVSIELILGILLLLVVMLWIDLNENELLGTIFLLGSFLALRATSLISLFISIEILSLTMIIIINLYINDKYPAILYYIFSAIFSAIFLLALAYLYFGYSIAYKFIYIVWIYKIGLAPFHILLPQIYNNLSPRIILLIDIPYKTILLYLLYRFNLPSFDLIYIIGFSLLVGSIGSLIHKNLLSLMVYSSIYNYALLLISLFYNNISYFLSYIIIYNLMIILYLYLINYKFIDRQINNTIYLFIWFILIMNLMGIPPLNGFFIKFFIFYLLAYNGAYLLLFLSSIGVLFLSYTYLRILLSMMISDKSFILSHPNAPYAHFISTILILSALPILF